MTNKEKYLNLCKDETTMCVYDMPWWMDAVCGEDNWDVILYEKGDQIMGSMVYFVKKKYGLKYITQPPFTQHNGIWIRYPQKQAEAKRISYEKEVITAIMEQVESLGMTYYMQNYSPNLTNWLPFYWKGYKQTSFYTYRLENISDLDLLFKNFQPDKKNKINKARKSGYQIKFDLSAKQFYDLHKTSLQKKGAEIKYSFELFERLYNAAYENNSGRTIYVTNEDGEPLSALFNVWDKQWGYDLISAIDPDTRNSGIPDLLVYSMMEYLSNKVCGYDFEGSMIPGVEESFRHLGAHQTPYFSIRKTYSNNPIIKLLIMNKLRR